MILEYYRFQGNKSVTSDKVLGNYGFQVTKYLEITSYKMSYKMGYKILSPVILSPFVIFNK